ncbi:MAG: phosphoribosylglycinamide formyltransferase [Christensenellaceae bacterium]
MKKIKIAVLVSGGGTNLQALLDAQKSGIIKSGEIALVISDKADAYALKRAETANVKTETVLRSQCADKKEFEKRIKDILVGNGIEIIVLAGFMRILSAEFTNAFKDRILNVHPSLIPSFCGEGYYGLKVHEQALKYGVKVTGATVHFVNEIPDGGKIIMQKAVDIKEGDTPEILQRRVMEQAEWIILPLSVEKVCSRLAAVGK